MGKIIVLEGLDGSGKATQAASLKDSLAKAGLDPMGLSFPDYDSPACGPVKMYLDGSFGANASDVNGYAASVLYAVDRFASYRTKWHKEYASGKIFVADRYTTSNAVYQTGKLPREEWDEYCRWLFEFEYVKMGIPKPDLVIYLDLDPEVCSRLISGRYIGDESKRDIHEKDTEFQKHSRDAALYCAAHQGWKVVKCDRDGKMRGVEEISSEILSLVREEQDLQ